MIDLLLTVETGVAEHHAHQNYQITVHSMVSLGELKVGRVSQLVSADSRRVRVSVVDFAATVDVDELLVKNFCHCIRIVIANRHDAKLLQITHSLKCGFLGVVD